MVIFSYLPEVTPVVDSTLQRKPEKPYPEFSLFPQDTKRWAKKIKGRTHDFGPWFDWKAAIERYQYEIDYLQQDKAPKCVRRASWRKELDSAGARPFCDLGFLR